MFVWRRSCISTKVLFPRPGLASVLPPPPSSERPLTACRSNEQLGLHPLCQAQNQASVPSKNTFDLAGGESGTAPGPDPGGKENVMIVGGDQKTCRFVLCTGSSCPWSRRRLFMTLLTSRGGLEINQHLQHRNLVLI